MTEFILTEKDPGCPCCDGEESGDWMDLCDDCLRGAMAGQYPHDGCERVASKPSGWDA